MSSENNVYRRAAANLAITAGAGQDAQVQTGITLDRLDTAYAQRVTFVFSYHCALAQAATLTLKDVDISCSAASDMSSPTVLVANADVIVATGATGGSASVEGIQKFFVHLGPSQRYLRLVYTPDLSASGTDTANMFVMAVFDEPEYGPKS